MQHHYSTINASEQREGIARVVHLFRNTPGGEVRREDTPAGGEVREKPALVS
jgi:hypothetical protein